MSSAKERMLKGRRNKKKEAMVCRIIFGLRST